MARRNSSIGFMGVFGRSSDLRQLDHALRAVDLHPKMVPEAVKLTTCALLKDQANSNDPPPQVYRPAAEIIAYCMIGDGGLCRRQRRRACARRRAADRGGAGCGRQFRRATGAADAARARHPAERGRAVRARERGRRQARVSTPGVACSRADAIVDRSAECAQRVRRLRSSSWRGLSASRGNRRAASACRSSHPSRRRPRCSPHVACRRSRP